MSYTEWLTAWRAQLHTLRQAVTADTTTWLKAYQDLESLEIDFPGYFKQLQEDAHHE